MKKELKRVVVTGGAGQIAYSLLFRIASGELFGADQPIALHLLEVPEVRLALDGVKMELEDCAFPLLKEINIGYDAFEVFAQANYVLLVGAKPRGPGMERKELLQENAKIFIKQGKALDAVADPNVKVLVVGNPCNTNCLIAMKNAPKLNPMNFFAMTMLDQNRASAQLAKKANLAVTDVSNVIVWGNHSSTQVPDFFNAKIQGKPVIEKINDKLWLENIFIDSVQKRGAAIIVARGKSSAASAASAIIDAMRALTTPTPAGQWFSNALLSNGNPYGIQEGLVYSFPCRTLSNGEIEIVKNVPLNEFLISRMKISEQELLEERAQVLSNC